MVLIYDHVEFSILRKEFRIYDQKKHNVYDTFWEIIFLFITKRIFLFHKKQKR